MNEARNEAKAEANLHTQADKALGASEQTVQGLSSKLLVEERERKNTEAGLKTIEAQVEEQHKKLHYTEI